MATTYDNRPRKSSKVSSPVAQYYLLIYNALSALLWFSILAMTVTHLAGYLPSTAYIGPITSRVTGATGGTRQQRKTLLSSIEETIPISSILERFSSSFTTSTATKKFNNMSLNISRFQLPGFLIPAWNRTATTYDAVGPFTSFVQTLAILDIVNILIGVVRSPLVTTAAQVASRLFAIWGLVEVSDVARTTPFYTSMVISWAIAETLKYAYHATSIFLSILASHEQSTAQKQNGNKELEPKKDIEIPYLLKYLRYTAFHILYPAGASSEAFVNYSTLPRGLPWPFAKRTWWSSVDALVNISPKWTLVDYAKGALFIIWWPALYIMMSHMVKQRRKVLGGGRGQKLGSKPKTL